jgi:Protein of unknown function (DUF1194)
MALTRLDQMNRNPISTVNLLLGLILAVAASLFSTVGPRAKSPEVDLALVLGVDCSYSVDAAEFRLQIEGLAQAFRRSDIHEAIRRGARGRIAVIVMEWSDDKNQRLLGSWTVLDTPASALAFAERIAKVGRELAPGSTAIGDALLFAASVLGTAPFQADRKVVDISSDGYNNRGDLVIIARDDVVARGITINGLPILNEFPTLDRYFEQQVIGGPNHFMISVSDYNSFASAIARKLLQEITGPGIS